jgi:hypothetical protein
VTAVHQRVWKASAPNARLGAVKGLAILAAPHRQLSKLQLFPKYYDILYQYAFWRATRIGFTSVNLGTARTCVSAAFWAHAQVRAVPRLCHFLEREMV